MSSYFPRLGGNGLTKSERNTWLLMMFEYSDPTSCEPSLVTVGARLACVSSFFRFLVRMEMVDRNPCDRLERPKAQTSPPRGLSADEVRRLLAVVPDTPVGLRNRALILTLVLTGRRRAEVFRLTRGDLSFDGDTCFYSYQGKGGKSGRRELPPLP